MRAVLALLLNLLLTAPALADEDSGSSHIIVLGGGKKSADASKAVGKRYRRSAKKENWKINPNKQGVIAMRPFNDQYLNSCEIYGFQTDIICCSPHPL